MARPVQRWAYSFETQDPYRDRTTGHRQHPRARDTYTGTGRNLCARGEWCATGPVTQGEDGRYTRQPAACPRIFCDADEQIIDAALEALPGLHARLSAAMLDWLTPEVMIRLPFGPSVPLRVDIDELQRLLVEFAAGWHEQLAAAERLDPPDTQDTRRWALGGRAGGLLDRSTGKLRVHLEAWLALPRAPLTRTATPLLEVLMPRALVVGRHGDELLIEASGADAGNEMLRLEYVGRACLAETEPQAEKLLGVACRSCADAVSGARTLRRAAPPQHEGDPVYASECAVCGHLMTPAEFRQWTQMNAQYWKARVTPAQLAARAGTTERDAERILSAVAG